MSLSINMKTTTYEWNTFEEFKPNDGQIILLQYKYEPKKFIIGQYNYEMNVYDIHTTKTIPNLGDYQWTNFIG